MSANNLTLSCICITPVNRQECSNNGTAINYYMMAITLPKNSGDYSLIFKTFTPATDDAQAIVELEYTYTPDGSGNGIYPFIFTPQYKYNNSTPINLAGATLKIKIDGGETKSGTISMGKTHTLPIMPCEEPPINTDNTRILVVQKPNSDTTYYVTAIQLLRNEGETYYTNALSFNRVSQDNQIIKFQTNIAAKPDTSITNVAAIGMHEFTYDSSDGTWYVEVEGFTKKPIDFSYPVSFDEEDVTS